MLKIIFAFQNKRQIFSFWYIMSLTLLLRRYTNDTQRAKRDPFHCSTASDGAVPRCFRPGGTARPGEIGRTKKNDSDNVLPFPTMFRQGNRSATDGKSDVGFENNVLKGGIIKKNDAGEASETEQGFVEFTEKEIRQMPSHFRKLIIIAKKRCRLRKKKSGKGTTYEIRYRANGYNLSACGKTIELAKANFIEKLRNTNSSEKAVESIIPTTFQSFAEYYFENFRKLKVSKLTYQNDQYRLRNHVYPTFGEREISKITPSDCAKLLSHLRENGLNKTADDVRSLLSVTFKAAIAHGILPRNPLDIVPYVKHEREHGKALTRDEETTLFYNVDGTPYKILYALALYCGLRPNEIKTVRIEGKFIVAINSKRKNQKVTYKKIPIHKKLDAVLAEIDYDLSKIDMRAEKTMSHRFPTYCFGHKLYDLRTTFYTRCDELNVAAPARDEFVGHSAGVLTNTYRDLSDAYLLKEGKKLNKW